MLLARSSQNSRSCSDSSSSQSNEDDELYLVLLASVLGVISYTVFVSFRKLYEDYTLPLLNGFQLKFNRVALDK